MQEGHLKRVRGIIRTSYQNEELYPLFLRKKKDGPTQWRGWEFLKGGIKPNESPLEAMFREFEEETGLNSQAIENKIYSLDIPKNVIKRRGKKKGQVEVIKTYLIDMPYVDKRLIRIDPEEHEKVEYFDRVDVIFKLLNNLKKGLIMDFFAFKESLVMLEHYEHEKFMSDIYSKTLVDKIIPDL